jgi:hypothetical protein
MLTKLLGISMLTAGISAAGSITSGTAASDLGAFGGINTTYSIDLDGVTQAGNPFSIFVGRPGGGTPSLGNTRCPNIGGAPAPVACTWGFSQAYTVNVDSTLGAFPGLSVLWDGTTYGLESGTPYALEMVFNVTTPPVTVMSALTARG